MNLLTTYQSSNIHTSTMIWKENWFIKRNNTYLRLDRWIYHMKNMYITSYSHMLIKKYMIILSINKLSPIYIQCSHWNKFLIHLGIQRSLIYLDLQTHYHQLPIRKKHNFKRTFYAKVCYINHVFYLFDWIIFLLSSKEWCINHNKIDLSHIILMIS